MLDVRRLRLLSDLHRLGTIAAVADARSYTASAVSQQLTALERETGVALLERTGRRVTLTAAGQVLVRHTETVLAALEEAGASLAAVRSGPAGPVRIGAFPSVMRTLLPPVLVTLGHDHPALELTVTELDPALVPAALRERRLDVGLTSDYDIAPAEPDPSLDSVPLLRETVYLAEPASTATGSVAGVASTPWILATPGTLCHEAILRVCRDAEFIPRARHHADDFATVLALVAAGQGVSLVPELAATTPPAGVRLTALPVSRRTSIGFRRGAAAHPAVAAVIAALRQRRATGASADPGDPGRSADPARGPMHRQG
ncbi:LysR family transcriptional regulator [Actinoplanes couchii]|uniref:LysR family transcriptional regulator n=1 Tax=Actinoplanes couchii TaxID=403638 RepID=A0ABQ3XMU3_9ACTN|nr:LysR family transcriptional regulator [Actinoplanes couchii]MDR6317839.1 DNA-binding transcriptional LysR family regulator [Actinoplanes couchii]GID59826.1 LysR family transcriptional regulator [Actinoplanes couchii]